MSAEPRWTTPRSDRATYGRECSKIAELLGWTPMEWQESWWDLLCEHEAGRLAYGESVLSVPRQCAKTTSALVAMVWRALKWPDQRILFGAQTGNDARRKLLDDWAPVLERSPIAPLLHVRKQSGSEAVLFENGSRIAVLASLDKSGHGGTIDAAYLDEAWAYLDYRLEAATRPAMVTRENAQLVVLSTAGTERRSPYFWDKTQTGRAIAESGSTNTGICFTEYSAAPEDDPSDPATWRRAVPALGHTISEAALRANFHSMPRSEFLRAHLNVWTASINDAVVSAEAWDALAVTNPPRPPWVVLALDVGPRDASASIVAVGEHDGELFSTVIESGPGTAWLPAALERACSEFEQPRVLADERSIAHLRPQLEQATGWNLMELGTADIPISCEFWMKLVTEGKLHHRGEPELAAALDGASTRRLGDGWAWSRRNSGSDITSLVAQTIGASFWLGTWGTT